MINTKKELNIQADVQNLYSWINLMPGTSDPSIHVTADIEIKNNEDFPLKNISIDKIELVSEDTSVELLDTEISPALDQFIIMTGELKTFNIKASKDLKQKVSFNKPVTLNLYFITESGMRKFEVKEVNIERVY